MLSKKNSKTYLPIDLRWAIYKYPLLSMVWILGSAIQAATFYLYAGINAITVDGLLVRGEIKQLPRILLFYFGASFLSVITALIVDQTRSNLALRSVNDWREALIQRFENEYVQTLLTPREQTLELALSDASEQRHQWNVWQRIVTAIFSIFVGIIVSISLNWKLLAVTIGFAAISSGVAFLFGKTVTKQSKNYFAVIGTVTSSLERLISSYGSLRALGLLNRFQNQYQGNQQKAFLALSRYSAINTLSLESQMVLTSMTGILTYLVFLPERSQNLLSIGIVSASVGVVTELIVGMRDLAQSIPERSQYAGCLDRMKDFINKPISIPEIRGQPFEVSSGFKIVTGVTGSGKTTKLLQTALQNPDRKQITLLPQQIDYPELSIREIFSNLPKDTTISELQALLPDNVLERNLNDLSGGERQLVALICVLSAKPQVLLLDESLSAMNPNLAVSVTEIIKKNRLGLTTLMITHQSYLHQYADEVFEVNSVDKA